MKLSERKLSAKLIGNDVALLQSELQQLGFVIDGAELERKYFGKTTQAAVVAFQKKNRLKATGVVDETTAALINRQIDAQGPRPASAPSPPPAPAPVPDVPPSDSTTDSPPPTTPSTPTIPSDPQQAPKADGLLIIRGHVRSEAGEGQPGITVRAVRVMLQSTTKAVGGATTETDGFYEIRCEMISPASPTRIDAYNRKKPIAQSALTCVRSGEVTLDLTISDEHLSGPTEYSRLVRLLAPFLEEIRPEQLTDSDIEILACAADVTRQRLLALRLAAMTCIEHTKFIEAVYGIVRMGRVADRRALLMRSEAQLRAALAAASKKRICETFSRDDVDALIALLADLRFEDALEPNSKTSLSAFLSQLVPEEKVQKQILAAYLAFKGTAEDFWSKALAGVAGLAPGARQQLPVVLGLAALTQGHAPLVQALMNGGAKTTITSLRDLVALTRNDWQALVATKGIGVPEGIPGNNARERIRNYAAILAQTVTDLQPTASLAADLHRRGSAKLKAAASVLDQNPEIDLTGRSIERALDGPNAPPKETVATLASVQRLFKIAPDTAVVSALYDANVHSAWAVANETPQTLQAITGNALSAQQVQQFHADAIARTEATLYLLGSYSDNVAGTGTPATPPPSDSASTTDKDALVKVFGAGTLCSCDDNGSLDGPWAYFVTLLMFLPQPVRAELQKRRPDLWELRFSRQNAETQARYLQFALEILENVAIDRNNNAAPGTSAWPKNQTTWSEEQLAAAVEYPNSQAYQPLLNSKFPWSLPFDVSATEARAFGQLLGVRRFELMEALQNRTAAPSPAPETIAMDFLGLSKAAWELISQPANAAVLNDLYPAIADRTKMTIAELLDRSALEPDELIALLNTRFVNPPDVAFAQRMGIASSDGTCDALTATLINPNDAALDRLHRITRLWRALPWPITELDDAIFALSRGKLDSAGLQQITQLARLRRQVNVPLEELLVWFSNIDTSRRPMQPSLYERLFLDKTITGGSGGAAFELQPAVVEEATDLKVATNLLRDSIPGIVAGIAATADDVMLLTSAGDKLQLASLSAVYRNVSLARTLALDVPAYLAVRKLIAVDPFNSVADAREFFDQFQRLKDSAFSLDELRFVLLDEIPKNAPADLGLSDGAVKEVVRQLRASLGATATDEAAAAALPASAENFAKQAGLVLPAAMVDTTRAIIERRSSDPQPQQQAFLAQLAGQWPFLDTALQNSLLANFTGTPTAKQIAARYALVLPPLIRFAGRQRRIGVVVQQLADRFELEPQVMQQLLTAPFAATFKGNNAATPIELLVDGLLDATYWSDPAQVPAATEVPILIRRLQKQALVLARSNPRIEELPRLVKLAQASGGTWLDLSTLPVKGSGAAASFAPLLQWLEYIDRRARQPLGRKLLIDVIDAGAMTFNAMLGLLADAMAWDATALTNVVSALGFSKPSDFVDQRVMRRVGDAMRLLARSQLPATTVLKWIADPVTTTAAADVTAAARSYIGVAQWPLRARPVRDEILERQCDALLAYLRGVGLPGEPPGTSTLPDEKDIFERYHLDMKMGAAFLTTRLALATRSIQYFIQQRLRGLAPTLEPEKAEQWHSFVSRYRPWQAAVDVVLNPHKYTDITLLTRRNERYLAFERSLTQRELTRENIATAVRSYVQEVLDIAYPEIAGMCEEPDSGTLHVVARTGATPAIYYYARRELGAWTSLSKLNTDLNAQGAVMPIVYHRTLYVIWPVLTEKAEDKQPNSKSDPPEPPKTHLEIQIGWSTLQDGKWSAKRLSDPILPLHWMSSEAPTPTQRNSLVFKAVLAKVVNGAESHEELRVICNLRGVAAPDAKSSVSSETSPEFRFQSCTRAPVIVQAHGTGEVVSPPGSLPWCGEYLELPDPRTPGTDPRETAGQENYLVTLTGPIPGIPDPEQGWPSVAPDHIPVLDQTPGQFRLVFPHQYAQPLSQSFFFQDDQWCFFVKYIGPTERVASGSLVSSVNLGAAASGLLSSRVLLDSPQQVAQRANERNRRLIDRQLGKTAASWTRNVDLTTHYRPMQLLYRFYTFNHPRACTMLQQLDDQGLPGIWRWNASNPVQAPTNSSFFQDRYAPESRVVDLAPEHLPSPDVEFDEKISPFAEDNQNIFLYCVLRAAAAFTAASKFDDAEWLLLSVYRPMGGGNDPEPLRYWTYQPFRDGSPQSLVDFLALLNGSDEAAAEAQAAIADWQKHPFDPWRVARHRPLSLMKTVVRMFIENVLARANQTFATANDQEQLLRATADYIYVLELTGEAPRALLPTAKMQAKPEDFRTFGMIESALPTDSVLPQLLESALPPLPPDASGGGDRFPFAVAMQFAFCLPSDGVFDPLRKQATVKLNYIRAGLDFNGKPRVYSVYGERIDPMLLVRAAAAGVDLDTALRAIEAPRPIYRFNVLLQKAKEFVADLRGLSASLLGALTENDAETLNEMRADQERAVLRAMQNVKEQALAESQHALDGLSAYLDVVRKRNAYYKSRAFMSPGEIDALEMTVAATILQAVAQGITLTASIVKAIPNFTLGVSGIASPVAEASTGGPNIGDAIAETSSALNMTASTLQARAGLTSTVASYQRRKDEWDMLADTTATEMTQVSAQIEAQKARVAAAQADLDLLTVQQENADAIRDFLSSRFNNAQLRQFRVAQLSSVCHQAYLIAFGLAKSAERAYQMELGFYPGTTMPQQSFIQFGYWQNNVNGVTAAEQLSLALQQLESAYLSTNVPEHVVTVRLSLALIDPLALESLRRTGASGAFDVLEEHITRFYPEAYFMRVIKTRVTTPCITGPFTPVPLKVSLTRHSIRLNDSLTSGQYQSTGSGDDRFLQSVGAVISMFTSTGRADEDARAGVDDGRYGWFEGAGVIGQYEISFAQELGQFDPATLTDVILELEMSFREGGVDFRNASSQHLQSNFLDRGYLLLRARADFPDHWYRFLNPAAGQPQRLELPLASERFPFAVQGKKITLQDLSLLAEWEPVANVAPPKQGIEAGVGTNQPLAAANALPATLAPVAGVQGLQALYYGAPNVALKPDAPATSLQVVVDASKLPTDYVVSLGTDQRVNPKLIRDVLLLCHYTAA
ncbi:MAG TPA: neuraminidase-like domain-containing protein [Steroidobacteraceae bacterium]|jgi:hypothetical protein